MNTAEKKEIMETAMLLKSRPELIDFMNAVMDLDAKTVDRISEMCDGTPEEVLQRLQALNIPGTEYDLQNAKFIMGIVPILKAYVSKNA